MQITGTVADDDWSGIIDAVAAIKRNGTSFVARREQSTSGDKARVVLSIRPTRTVVIWMAAHISFADKGDG